MISLIMSALLLIAPPVIGIFIGIYLWRRGLLGRIGLLAMLIVAAVEVHSFAYPQESLRVRYAQIMV